MTLGPTLTTQRLILRPPTQDDFPAFANMMADGDHVRFVGGQMGPALAWRTLATLTGAWVLRGFSMFSVIEKDTGAWVGRIGPWYPEGWPGKEIGWGLSRAATGKGYAHEAAAACMDYVFDSLNWEQVIHVIAHDNIGSIGVAKRLGSTNLGPTKLPPPLDMFEVDAWGQTREQWRTRCR